MDWSETHATVLCRAYERLLGQAEQGAMAFARCLPAPVVAELARDARFAPAGWLVRRVADLGASGERTITADEAVELREEKTDPVLLLVDVARAGAGMDGIYSAAREIDEDQLFKEAIRLAAREVTRSRSSDDRRFAEQAVKKARGWGQRNAIAPWVEFDFIVRVAAERRFPGELLYLLGLWPIIASAGPERAALLDLSRTFVDRLMSPPSAAPSTRDETLAQIVGGL